MMRQVTENAPFVAKNVARSSDDGLARPIGCPIDFRAADLSSPVESLPAQTTRVLPRFGAVFTRSPGLWIEGRRCDRLQRCSGFEQQTGPFFRTRVSPTLPRSRRRNPTLASKRLLGHANRHKGLRRKAAHDVACEEPAAAARRCRFARSIKFYRSEQRFSRHEP